MKTFRILVVICLLLFLLGSFALFIFTTTFDAQRFKALLISQISAQTGRETEMANLDLSFSLSRGLFLHVQEFSLWDDAQFSQDVLLSVADLKLDLDIVSFLTQKKIAVSHVTIESPRINLVRDEKGELNIQALASMMQHPSDKKKKPDQGTASVPGVSRKDIPKFPELLVRAIRIEQGSLTFVDKAQAQVIQMELKNIALDIDGLSSLAPCKFTLIGSVLSDARNLQVRGQGQLNLKNLQVRFDDVQAQLDLSAIDLNELEKAVPSLKAADWGLAMQGKMQTFISQAVIGQDGLLLLAGTGKITQDAFNLEKLSLFIKGTVDYEVSEKDIQFRDIALSMGGGGFASGEARIDDYLKQQKYFIDLNVKDIPLHRSIPEFGPQAHFQGTLNGQVNFQGEGFKLDKLFSSLAGEGKLNIAPGTIENFNIFRFILSQITMLPELDQVLIKNLPESSRKPFEQRGSVFENIAVKARLSEGQLIIDEADFVSSAYSAQAQGQFDGEKNMSFSATLFARRP